jgi:hypothetical protein
MLRRQPGWLVYFLIFLRLLVDLTAALRAGLAADFAAGFTTALTSTLGTSPMTDLTGQILKMGHFWQPTAMAMGQMVMVFFSWVALARSAAVCPGASREVVPMQGDCP